MFINPSFGCLINLSIYKLQQMQSQTSKLLTDIKKKNVKKPLTFEHLLCILNHGEIQPNEAKRFLVEKHNVKQQPLNWLNMSFEEIQKISNDCRQYIRTHRAIWQQEQRKKIEQEEQEKLMQQQKQRLRLQMIRKNITKQKMIEMCQQSIKKCQDILEVGVQDQQEYQRLKNTVKQLKRQLLILQGNYFENIQQQLKEQQTAEIAAKQSLENPQMLQIIEQIKQRKRREQEEKRLIIQKLKQQQQNLFLKQVKQLTKKMKLIYNSYSKEMYQPGLTFESNSNHMKLFDMKIFIKYTKDFQIANAIHNIKSQQKQVSSKISSQFENSSRIHSRAQSSHKNLIKLFKVYAKNGIWLDFIHFVFLHLQLVNLGLQYQTAETMQIICQDDLPKLEQYKIQLRKIRKASKTEQQVAMSIDKKVQSIQKLNQIISKKKVFDVFNPMCEYNPPQKQKITKNRLQELIPHTGIYKQDILKKLKQRKQQRQQQKQQILALSKNFERKRHSMQKMMTLQQSNVLQKFDKIHTEDSKISRITTPLRNFVRDLSLPRLSRRQQKQKSIYDSLNKLKKNKNIIENINDFNLLQSKLFKASESKISLKDEDDIYLNQMFNKDKKSNGGSSRKKQKIIKSHMKFT